MKHAPQHPPLSVDQIRKAIIPVLMDIKLAPGSVDCSIQDDGFLIRPKTNTWSRAARRQAARAEIDPAGPAEAEPTSAEPLFVAQLSFLGSRFSAHPESQSVPVHSEVHETRKEPSAETSNVVNARLVLEWHYGEDRGIVDAFWKFLLTKAGLLGPTAPSGGVKRNGGDSEDGEQKGNRGRGRGGRGGAGGRRGRGRIAVGSRY